MTRLVFLLSFFFGFVLSSFGQNFTPTRTNSVPGVIFESYLITKFGYSTAENFDDLNTDANGHIFSTSAFEAGECDYPFKYYLHPTGGTYQIYFPGAKRADTSLRGLFGAYNEDGGLKFYQYVGIEYPGLTGSVVYVKGANGLVQNGFIVSALAHIVLKQEYYDGQHGTQTIYYTLPVSGSRQYNNNGDELAPNLQYLPVYWTEYQHNQTTVIQPNFYVNPGRKFLLHTVFFPNNLTPENASQCIIALNICKMCYTSLPRPNASQKDVRLGNVNVVYPNDSNIYNTIPTRDTDSGGEIDIFEWASRRNRLDPADDSTECLNTVFDPENPEDDPDFGKSQEVEIGPNSRDWFDQEMTAQNRWLGGDGQAQAVIPSTVDLPELPPIELPSVGSGAGEGEDGAPPTAEGAFDRFNSDVSTAVNGLPQTQKGKELFSPVSSGGYAKWSLPKVEVEVIGSATDVEKATELRHTIDLTSLSFDFEALHDPKIERFFLILRSVLALLIYAFTAWRLYRLFAGLVSNSTLGGDGGDE